LLHMRDVTTKEGKSRFEKLARRAENGETTTITRDGEPVAAIAPVPKKMKGGTEWEAGYRYMREAGIDKVCGGPPRDFADPLPEDFLITPLGRAAAEMRLPLDSNIVVPSLRKERDRLGAQFNLLLNVASN